PPWSNSPAIALTFTDRSRSLALASSTRITLKIELAFFANCASTFPSLVDSTFHSPTAGVRPFGAAPGVSSSNVQTFFSVGAEQTASPVQSTQQSANAECVIDSVLRRKNSGCNADTPKSVARCTENVGAANRPKRTPGLAVDA